MELFISKSAVMEGGTVIVTPGISRGEQLMKNECIERGYPLIHLQATPIGRYWKPEKTLFFLPFSLSLQTSILYSSSTIPKEFSAQIY